MKYKNKYLRKLTFSSVIIAVYLVLMLLTSAFAYGNIQIRIATSLYSLAAFDPLFILPLGIANSLSNMIGPFGPVDIIGGFIVGIITGTFIYWIKRFKLNDWLIALPIIFGPGLIVSIWLHVLLDVPYIIFAGILCLEQVIPGISGVLLYKEMKRILFKEE